MITVQGWAVIAGALGGVFLALVTLNPVILLAAIGLFAFLAMDILGFHARAARLSATSFDAKRGTVPARVGLGSSLVSRVDVRYEGTTGFWGRIEDLVPERLEPVPSAPALLGWWTPSEAATLSADLRAIARGPSQLGPTVVTAIGPQGLSFVAWTVEPGADLLVTPADPVAGRLRARPLPGVLLGGNRRRQRGYGTEFRSLRPFTGGDDIRLIAWRRSTLERLLVREHEEEIRQDHLVAIDTSGGMAAGAGLSLLDRAVGASLAIAHRVDARGEDRLGLLTGTGDRLEYLAPGRGGPHLARLEEVLARLEPSPGAFDLGRALDEAALRLPARAHVFVLTTLGLSESPIAPALGRLAGRGHRLRVFVLRDVPSELGGPRGTVGPAARWAVSASDRAYDALSARLSAERVGAVIVEGRDTLTHLLGAYEQGRAWGGAM